MGNVSFRAGVGKRFDEILVFLSLGALDHRERLAMRLSDEGGRADIRHPDFERPQPLLPQPDAMGAYPLLRGSGV